MTHDDEKEKNQQYTHSQSFRFTKKNAHKREEERCCLHAIRAQSNGCQFEQVERTLSYRATNDTRLAESGRFLRLARPVRTSKEKERKKERKERKKGMIER